MTAEWPDSEIWENLSVMSDEDVADLLAENVQRAIMECPLMANELIATYVRDIRNGERVRISRSETA